MKGQVAVLYQLLLISRVLPTVRCLSNDKLHVLQSDMDQRAKEVKRKRHDRERRCIKTDVVLLQVDRSMGTLDPNTDLGRHKNTTQQEQNNQAEVKDQAASRE